MRICLLGDFTGAPDEGMKNISKNMHDRLVLRHHVLPCNSRDILKIKYLKNIRLFKPEIIHYLHGPTIRSLIILKLSKSFCEDKAKTIITATRPHFSKYSRWAVRFFKPDLALTQAIRYEHFFKQNGFRVKFFPNGVNCNKFVPPTGSEKPRLRKDFGLADDKTIVLHVGHIKANRNLETFKEIQKLDRIQVVIVGGTTEKTDENIKKDLEKSGIKIFHKYFEDISKVYQLSDLYVFPVRDTGSKFPLTYNQVGSIDLPLSIMEAMACNLHVITTPFGALSRLFKPGDGLYFCDTEEEIINKIKQLYDKDEIATRDKVLPYDWGEVIKRLEKIYQEIVI